MHSYPSVSIFYGYGRLDSEVSPALHEETISFLRDALRLPADQLTFKRYCGLGHLIEGSVLADFSSWLRRLLQL